MSEIVTLQISDKIYWGFNIKIERKLLNEMTHEQIIDYAKIKMKEFFNSYNLLALKEGVDNLDLHVHYDEDLNILYLCDHYSQILNNETPVIIQ